MRPARSRKEVQAAGG